MKALKLTAQVDEHHRLVATVPSDIPPGPIEIVIALAGDSEDDVGAAWALGVSLEWSEELNDSREDIYTVSDGRPIDGRR